MGKQKKKSYPSQTTITSYPEPSQADPHLGRCLSVHVHIELARTRVYKIDTTPNLIA